MSLHLSPPKRKLFSFPALFLLKGGAFLELAVGRFISVIQSTVDIRNLKKIHDRFIELPANHQKVDLGATCLEQLNILHDQLITKTLHLVEEGMKKEGWVSPPVSFCWILLGSGARKEQTLWTDQDNGIIYKIGENQGSLQGEALRYLKEFARRAVLALNEVGYPLCEGNVMATNPVWFHSLEEWKEQWRYWVAEPSVDHLRYFLISTDFRGVYGQIDLAEELRRWFIDYIQEQPRFLHRLASHAREHPVPINFLGRIFPEAWGSNMGRFDVKQGVYVQLVNMVRLWSLKYGVYTVNTEERIKALYKKGIWKEKDAISLIVAYRYVVNIRLQAHVKKGLGNLPHDNYIHPSELPAEDLVRLKKAMKLVKKWQRRTYADFKESHRGEKKNE